MTARHTWARLLVVMLAASGLALLKVARMDRQATIAIVDQAPSNLAVGVAPNPHISVTFAGKMNSATLTPATVQLLDNAGNIVPSRLSYNLFNRTVTLDPLSPLSYGTTYQVRVNSGKSGIEDAAGNQLENPIIWSFTTAWSPASGPGGPLLVIVGGDNPFSTYYAEILRAEGLNEFAVSDASAISPAMLSRYQLAILGDVPLTSSQVSQLSDWINQGGKLIAMHPRANLCDLLGVIDRGSSLAEGYVAVDRSDPMAAGIESAPMQFHGQAGQYALLDARALATLYHDANAPLASPAVTLRDVGVHGGMAGAFMFDLAKSVVLTRQGNPAWARQRRTGAVWGDWTQSADLFYGPASFDPQKNWCDFNNIAIPQADEAQRLLANMIVRMNLATAPLPRFSYFPSGAKAVVVLTGDDHNSGGTGGRFQRLKAAGDSGGMPITATSYLYPGYANPDATLASYASQGFESALHFEVTNGALFGTSSDMPADWTSLAQLDRLYSSETFSFNATYPSLASSRTGRTHGPVWSDYDSLPQVEFAHGVRLDTSYYFAPPQWVQDHPGFFTGSGIPMRFATSTGTTIDVYQATTQITDESGQSEPLTIDKLLDNATGPKEYLGAFTVNAHDDEAINPLADAVIDSAKDHHVPILSAQNLLDFEDGRGNSSFGDISWNASAGRLTFSIMRAFGGKGLQAMVPLSDAAGRRVATIHINGSPVSFRSDSYNAIGYAVFPAECGLVSVQYAAQANQ
ncbi:MAG: Ig-like domain-containing protein [Tepidisphaeraceae bacterium]